MNKEITNEDLIKELSLLLKEKYNDFKGIYFFGSRIKPNFNTDSDYDMVFLFDRKIDWRFRKEIVRIVYDLELKHDIFIDAKIYNTKEILEPVTPFRQAVLTEGIFYVS